MLAAGGPLADVAEDGAASALVAVLPHANQQCLFLLAPDLQPVKLRWDAVASGAVSAFRLQTETRGVVRLRHPLVPDRYLGVTPKGADGAEGSVLFDRSGESPLDVFTLLPAGGEKYSDAFRHAAREITEAVTPPFGAAAILRRLREFDLRPGFVAPVLRVLPRDELFELGRLLLEIPDTLALLQQRLPHDPWFARVLPALVAWQERRSLPAGGVLRSPASDEFACDPMEGRGQVETGQVLTALARRRIAPDRGPCLLAAARNEGVYFLEWLAYHRAIGFEHAFIYTNDNSDGSDGLLEALADAGEITLVRSTLGEFCGPQRKMHAHALNLLPQILAYRWVALIDIDEFIGFDTRRFASIADFLAWHETQPVDAIALCTQIFAAGADERWRDASSLERFTWREGVPEGRVKSIFRPGFFWHAEAHYPLPQLGLPFLFRGADGGLHYSPGGAAQDPAVSSRPATELGWINHYFLRTAPELLWKMARGHPDWKAAPAERQLDMARWLCGSFCALAGRTEQVEDRRILACAPGLAEEVARLRALPAVSAAEERTRVEFMRLLPNMVRAFVATTPEDGEEPPEFPPFREILRRL